MLRRGLSNTVVAKFPLDVSTRGKLFVIRVTNESFSIMIKVSNAIVTRKLFIVDESENEISSWVLRFEFWSVIYAKRSVKAIYSEDPR